MSADGWSAIAVIVWLVGVIVTFGPVAVHYERCGTSQAERDSASGPGLILAIVWPIYWPARASYELAGGAYECGR